MLPLGPPDEFGSPYRVRLRVRGLAAAAGEAAGARDRAARSRPSSRATRTGPARWARFAGAGALADQVRFEREWGALRAYAAERGVRLIGDVPIYVADDGADVAGWPELFAAGEVAGAPPDDLSAGGQRWGNPLYDWPAHRATGYRWWIERFRRTFELVDVAPRSTTSAASSPTGRSRRTTGRRSTGAGGAAPAPSSSARSSASSASCR